MGEKFSIHTTADQFREGAKNKKECIEIDIENIENNDELKELKNASAIIEALVEIVKDGENIGTGRSAEVRMLEKKPDTCIKIIKDKSETIHNAEEEMKLQSAAKSAGIRVPNPICSITTENGYDFIVMETIKGHSIEDYINNNIKLPEDLDIDIFFKDVKVQLEKMHNNGLYHRDFHGGNLMIEEETLEAVIIDFGKSKETYVSDDKPYHDEDIRGTNVLPDDINEFRKIKRQLYELKIKQEKMKGGGK